MQRAIGIDPGAKGAFALFVNGKLTATARMPTVSHKGKARVDGAAVGALLRSWAPLDHAYMERVGAMPGQGVSSMFAFGMAAGIVQGALGALCVPMTLISPAQWKVALRVPAAKDGARARASQLIPEGASRWPLVKDDGIAEAALIGLYGSRSSLLTRDQLNGSSLLDARSIEW